MRDLLNAIKGLLPALYAWSPFVGSAIFVAAWLIIGVVVWYVFMYRPGVAKLSGTSQDAKGDAVTPQTQTIAGSPGAMQAGRDIVINPPTSQEQNGKTARDQQERDARQKHLTELQAVLRQDAEKFKNVADGMRSSGAVTGVLQSDAELKDVMKATFISNEILDSDLANHYPDYATKKTALVQAMEQHAKEFSAAASTVLRTLPASISDRGDRENVAVSVVMRCVLGRDVMVLEESGQFSSPRGTWGSIRGQERRFVEMERAYKDFKPDSKLINQCGNIRDARYGYQTRPRSCGTLP
jgi:hypothetical protein